METRIKEVCERLRHCALSDNGVDYIEKELLYQNRFKAWESFVKFKVSDLVELIKIYPKVDMSKEHLTEEEKKLVDDWDHKYNYVCNNIIGDSDRHYEAYKTLYSYWGRPCLDKDGYMEIHLCKREGTFAISEDEEEVLRQEFAMRCMHGVMAKSVYIVDKPKIIKIVGMDTVADAGMCHIYFRKKEREFNDLHYTFPESSIPYLFPKKSIMGMIKVGGTEHYPLVEWAEKKFGLSLMPLTFQIKDGKMTYMVGEKKWEFTIDQFILDPFGRKMAMKYHIDINDLLPKKLALNAEEERVYD